MFYFLHDSLIFMSNLLVTPLSRLKVFSVGSTTSNGVPLNLVSIVNFSVFANQFVKRISLKEFLSE
jgi:hypothetical protein